MYECFKVHKKAHSKVFTIFGIILVLSLINFICFIVNRAIVLNKLDYYEENDPDIIITVLSKVQFLEKKMPEEYKVSAPNLGSTGKKTFDCFRGECIFKKKATCYETRCTGRKHRSCKDIPIICLVDDYRFVYDCSHE